MATAERVCAPQARAPRVQLLRRWAWPALGVVLVVGLGLRLWGIQQGLPYAYNADEADHFVPHAVAMFGHGLNPHYFANPPAFTYVLHYLFAIAYGGGDGVRRAFALQPTEVYTLARIAAASRPTARPNSRAPAAYSSHSAATPSTAAATRASV